MAALRRLLHPLANGSRTGTFTAQKQQTSSKATKALKVVAAGAGVTAAAGAAYYYCWPSVGRGSGVRSHVEARLVHLALPSVSATDKVQWDICRFSDDIHLTQSNKNKKQQHLQSFKNASISFFCFSNVNTALLTGSSAFPTQLAYII